MGAVTDKIRERLGIPAGANYVVLFDQAAHLDWDWIEPFNQYFLKAYSGQGVNGALQSALALLSGNGSAIGPYYYSVCEMGYLQKFVSYQAQQGNDVVTAIRRAGASLRIVGGGITSPDNLVCSGEAFIRNYLLGKLWLKQTFPETLPLRHCWIPDDFGQDPELPVVVQALGMTSVAFWRLPQTNIQLCDTLLENGLDFFWQASDRGSKVYAHWLQGGYGQGKKISDGDVIANINSYLESNSVNQSAIPPYSGAPTNYAYVPIDDDFMMPVSGLLGDMKTWNGSDNGYLYTGTYAVAASFDDFAALALDYSLDNPGSVQTVRYNGTPYWTGYYMSRPAMKILHYDAVRALLSAEVFGLLAAPGNFLDPGFRQRLMQVWTDFMPSTHHDYVCGTANDEVYQLEQLPLLRLAHRESRQVARAALEALASAIAYTQADSNPVVVANPAGVPCDGIVELTGPVPAGVHGVQFGSAPATIVQPTHEGGAVFLAPVASLGYATGYFTTAPGTIPVAASVAPATSGQATYTLKNQYLTVVIDEACNWGIASIQDQHGNSLLKPNGIGNDLVFYADQGDIYQFGNEVGQSGFGPETFNWVVKGQGLGATVLEQGPVRVRVLTTVRAEPKSGGSPQTYMREYMLVSGEPFLRMKTTGAANPGYSIMTAFPLARPVGSITHGTACHWTDVQPYEGWSRPVFRATHRFVLPLDGSRLLGAIYHRDVPAWAFTDAGVLIGCLLRNTRGRNTHGAVGTDFGTHTLEYAFRVFDGLGDPATGQPLNEALRYTMPPAATVPVWTSATASAPTLPESGFLASIESPAVILAAKPGDVDPGALVLRLYQPTNGPRDLSVSLGAGPPSRVTAVTALEDPIPDPIAPRVVIDDNIVRVGATTALSTIAITSATEPGG
jgi:alpha-mannosidase